MSARFTEPVTDSIARINDEVAIGEDLDFQRRWWRFERFVWILFVLVIILDLGGAFGRGPLANAEARSSERSIEVTYERIQRSGTPSMMTVHLSGAAVQNGFAELSLSDSAVSGLGLRRVIPAPERTTVGPRGMTYRFPASQRAAVVRFEFEPAAAGRYTLTIGIASGPSVQMRVWVVP